jgi:hypothetical protein
MYVLDSRFPRQYIAEAIAREKWTDTRWRDTVMTRSGLDWGALGILCRDRNGFATILLHKGLVSVALAAPQDLDGTRCDVVEIKMVNNIGGESIDRLAIARSDGFVRLLEVEDQVPTKGPSILRERYFRLRAFNPMTDTRAADESALSHFVPPSGARRVNAFQPVK